jgi:peptide methionine sulfoxide reductase msrA/msrB
MNTNKDYLTDPKLEVAIFAGGCFWGVENLMMKFWPGVQHIESGYTGGHTENPTYEQVKAHTTGHAEAVRIFFYPYVVDFETLAKLFFEIHDPTQVGGQGTDIGDQYRSEIFYTNPAQKATAEMLIAFLRSKGYDVVTKVTPASEFWVAEDYHQRYFERTGAEPDCHRYVKRF